MGGPLSIMIDGPSYIIEQICLGNKIAFTCFGETHFDVIFCTDIIVICAKIQSIFCTRYAHLHSSVSEISKLVESMLV